MFTDSFYIGLEAGLSKSASIDKEAVSAGGVTNFFRNSFKSGSKGPGSKIFGKKMWRSAGGAPKPDSGAFSTLGTVSGGGLNRGMDAFKKSRKSGSGFFDSLSAGVNKGQHGFNSMFKSLNPELQKGVTRAAKKIGYGAAGLGVLGVASQV